MLNKSEPIKHRIMQKISDGKNIPLPPKKSFFRACVIFLLMSNIYRCIFLFSIDFVPIISLWCISFFLQTGDFNMKVIFFFWKKTAKSPAWLYLLIKLVYQVCFIFQLCTNMSGWSNVSRLEEIWLDCA